MIVAIMKADKAREIGLSVIDEPPAGEVFALDRNGDDFGIYQHAITVKDDGLRRAHLAPPEQFFDVGEFQLDIGRAAMIALA